MKLIIVCFINLLILWPALLQAQDAPVSSLSSIVTDQETAVISISSVNFNNIGSCNLKLQYDSGLATAVSVQTSPQLGGMLSTDLNVPGVISLGWFKYPAATLPDNSVIFNITFNKLGPGTTPVIWDDDNGVTCEWWNGNFEQLFDTPTEAFYIDGSLTFLASDAPQTTIAQASGCENEIISIPVSVNNYNTIGSFFLTLNYDPQLLSYLSCQNIAALPGFSVIATAPGTITVSSVSYDPAGITLPDNTTLFAVEFIASAGSGSVTWQTGPAACYFTGPSPSYSQLNDFPYELFYTNGSFTGIPLPLAAGSITGPPSGNICAGIEAIPFSVQPVANADTYAWYFPSGYTIISGQGTNSVLVSAAPDAGNGSAVVFPVNSCGAGQPSPGFDLWVHHAPSILVQPQSPPAVTEGSGTAVFTIAVTGSEMLYKWQEFNGDWYDIYDNSIYSGVFTPELIITDPPIIMNGYRYRCIVSGMCDPPVVSDGQATLTIIPFLGTLHHSIKPRVLAETNFQVSTGTYIISCTPDAGGILTIDLLDLSGRIIHHAAENLNRDEKYITWFRPVHSGIYLVRIIFSDGKQITSNTMKIPVP